MTSFSILRWIIATAFVVPLLMLAGCSAGNYTPAPRYYTSTTTTSSYRGTRTEVASWYGPGFAGHTTSTGEVYNPYGLTAASKTLPLGSHVRVTNPDTGRSVVVRINDRGPYVHGRSLDLSQGAAQQIGLTGKGVGRVQVTPSASSTPSIAERSAVYNYSSVAYTPATTPVRYTSYSSTSTTVTRRRYRRHSYRTVSNPIGAWLSSALPRL